MTADVNRIHWPNNKVSPGFTVLPVIKADKHQLAPKHTFLIRYTILLHQSCLEGGEQVADHQH